jgi:hypothetical protein
MQLQKLIQSLPAPETIAAEAAEFGESRSALIKAKSLSVWLDKLDSLLKPSVINEMTEKTFQLEGATITVAERREYGYNHDSKWLTLKKAEEQASEARKAHEKLMLSLPTAFADTETGEVIHPAKLLGVKSIVSTTLPK